MLDGIFFDAPEGITEMQILSQQKPTAAVDEWQTRPKKEEKEFSKDQMMVFFRRVEKQIDQIEHW
eukprot:GSA120T00010417001.1